MVKKDDLRLFITHPAIVLIFIQLVGSGPPDIRQVDRSRPDIQNHPGTDTVLFHVTVTDKQAQFIRDLTREEFYILDKKTLQDIAFFSFQDTPVSVGLVFDSSGSMKNAGNQFASILRENLLRFIVHSNQSNEYFVLSFSDKPRLVLDWTGDRTAIGEAIESSYLPTGGASLYDACYIAIEKVQQGKHSKRVILFVSDGEATLSTYNLMELRRLISGTDVIIYSIGLRDPYIDTLAGFSREVMKDISLRSGGRAFFPQTVGEFAQAVIKISVELRNQYLIGIRDAGDGKWHDLKIRIDRKEKATLSGKYKPAQVVVRSRSGYFASKSKG